MVKNIFEVLDREEGISLMASFLDSYFGTVLPFLLSDEEEAVIDVLEALKSLPLEKRNFRVFCSLIAGRVTEDFLSVCRDLSYGERYGFFDVVPEGKEPYDKVPFDSVSVSLITSLDDLS